MNLLERIDPREFSGSLPSKEFQSHVHSIQNPNACMSIKQARLFSLLRDPNTNTTRTLLYQYSFGLSPPMALPESLSVIEGYPSRRC